MKTLSELGISPAPWNDGGFGVPKALSDANGEIIVTVHATKNMDANDRLIAAAPELYEALELCERKLDAIEPYGELLVQVRAALAKASGEEVAE